MKIAIIGSRNYTNKTQIKNFMFRLKMEYKDMEIVSGGAKDGADKYAKTFALEFGLDYSEFPPQHETHNIHCVLEPYNYGKPYAVWHYHTRNKQIAEYSDAVVAFVPKGITSKGTNSALKEAEKKDKKYVIIN